MEFWDQLTELLLHFLNRYDNLAVALLIFMEESGVPLPVPGDAIMILAGIRIGQGEMSLLLTWVSLFGVTLVGASILYWLAARGGRPLLYRYGRFLRLTPQRLSHVEKWIQRRGAWAVFFGRLVPGLRVITPMAAGVFGVPYRTFLPALAGSAALYISVYLALGMFVGPMAIEALQGLRFSLRAGVSLLLFVGVGGFMLYAYREIARRPDRRRTSWRRQRIQSRADLETALLAGLLATLEMGLGVNLALYLFGWLDITEPEGALLAFIQNAANLYFDGSGPRFAALLVTALTAGGLAWAVIYAALPTDYLVGSPWMQGLIFSAIPFAVSVLVLLPLMGAGLFGLGLQAGLWPLAGELFRNALFGAGLGTSYALLREARAPRRERQLDAPAVDA